MHFGMWSDVGAGLTLAGDVGAGAMGTFLPQTTVAPLLPCPVVGSSGQYCEEAGQEIQQIASSLKAPLHPHAKGAAAKDIKVGLAHILGSGKAPPLQKASLPKHPCLVTSRSPTLVVWWFKPVILASRRPRQEIESSRLTWAIRSSGPTGHQCETLSQFKQRNRTKQELKCSSAVECLPGMHTVLGSIPSRV